MEKQILNQLNIPHLIPFHLKIKKWPIFVALITLGVISSFLTEDLTFGPKYFSLAATGVLIVALIASLLHGHSKVNRFLAFTTIGFITVGLSYSVIMLVIAILKKSVEPSSLFTDAILLWVSNVIVFSIWYWQLDRGGPILRHLGLNRFPDLFFPQMQDEVPCSKDWIPGYIDYLFVAFNTSTAFSPTDTMVLSVRCKMLSMTQSIISLVVLAMLAARAINLL